jgi:hypothetical protein
MDWISRLLPLTSQHGMWCGIGGDRCSESLCCRRDELCIKGKSSLVPRHSILCGGIIGFVHGLFECYQSDHDVVKSVLHAGKLFYVVGR